MVEANPKLIEKLDAMIAQFDQIEQQLVDPAVLSNHERIRDLSIKRAALADLTTRYRRYRAFMAQIRDSDRIVPEIRVSLPISTVGWASLAK